MASATTGWVNVTLIPASKPNTEPTTSICKCSTVVFLQGLENTYKPPGQGYAWNTYQCGMVAHIFLMTFLYEQNPSREAGYSGPKYFCQFLLFLRAGLKFSIQGLFFFWDKLRLLQDDLSKLLSHSFLPVQGLLPQDFWLLQKYLLRDKDIGMGSCSGLAGSKYFFYILMYFWNIRNSLFKNSWQIFELYEELKYLWTLEWLCWCISASRCKVPACLLFCFSCLQIHWVK